MTESCFQSQHEKEAVIVMVQPAYFVSYHGEKLPVFILCLRCGHLGSQRPRWAGSFQDCSGR